MNRQRWESVLEVLAAVLGDDNGGHHVRMQIGRFNVAFERIPEKGVISILIEDDFTIARRPCADLQPADFGEDSEDRKSTRLNSSHGYISYAVFCLKKKKKKKKTK